MRPTIRVVQIKGHPAQPYIVNVYDTNGELIMWCGPYDHIDRDNCIHLFRQAGWVGRALN